MKFIKKRSLQTILGSFTKTLSELQAFQEELSVEGAELDERKAEIEKRQSVIVKESEEALRIEENIKNLLGQ